MIEADYIFLDFLVEDLKVSDKKHIEDELWYFITEVRRNGLMREVVLLKLYYTERYGIHPDKCRKFEEIDNIRALNQILQKWYEDFEDSYGEQIKSVICFDDAFHYTYEHTKEGCHPWYYNGRFHEYAGEKIRKELISYV